MGGQGAKCLVMALGQGPGGPKVLFGTYSHMQKVKNWGQGGHDPLDLLLIMVCISYRLPCEVLNSKT